MSDNEKYKGYRGAALSTLKNFGVQVWSDVEVATTRGDFKGIILPRSETADDHHIVLKLRNGYNVGLAVETITEMGEKGYKKANYKIPEKEFPHDPKKPRVKLFGTGGTIASRLDYRTGAVIPAFSPGELYGSVPELAIFAISRPKNFMVCSARIWDPSNGSALQRLSGGRSKKA